MIYWNCTKCFLGNIQTYWTPLNVVEKTQKTSIMSREIHAVFFGSFVFHSNLKWVKINANVCFLLCGSASCFLYLCKNPVTVFRTTHSALRSCSCLSIISGISERSSHTQFTLSWNFEITQYFLSIQEKKFYFKTNRKKTNKATKMDRGIDDSLKIEAKVQIYLDYLTYKSI